MKKEDKEKTKKEKVVYIDDGRTVVDMDNEYFPWHGRSKRRKDKDKIPFKEKLLLLWGAYKAYFPFLLILLLTLGALFFIMKLWLG